MSKTYTPVLGCAPVDDERAADYQHRWLVGDEQGRGITAIDCPALGCLDISLRMGYLVLRAPGMLRLDIPLDVIEDDDSVCRLVQIGADQIAVVDEGNLAATWLSNCLGCACRLYKVHPVVDLPTACFAQAP